MNELGLDKDYFDYLLYSYQLSQEDGEEIIYQLKDDLYEGEINEFTLINKLEYYCNLQIINNEKEEKIRFLYTLIDSDDYIITKIKKQNKLTNSDILTIAEKIESDIERENIPKYLIKRYLENYSRQNYFINKNLKELKKFSSQLDNVFINKTLKKVGNMNYTDVRNIISDLETKIKNGDYYTSNMKTILTAEIEIESKNKKIRAQKQLSNLYEKSEESFNNLLNNYNLTFEDKEKMINRLEELISEGKLQQKEVKSTLIRTVLQMGKEKELNEKHV